MGVIRKIVTGKLFSNLLQLFLYFLFIFYLGKNVQKCQKKGQFWAKWPKDVSTDGIKGLSTNLYGSLWFGTNERVLLRWRYPTIGSLCPPITTTKGEGYYVEFFYKFLHHGVNVVQT